MNEMVERVAKAIAKTCEPNWDGYEEMARAAIEAMRKPTEAMIEAGTEARWQSAVRDANSIREIWNAGIDAALKE